MKKCCRNEKWKPILGERGEFYEVSSCGRVRRYRGRTGIVWKEPKLIKSFDAHGYRELNLQIRGKQFWCSVHRLVIETFQHAPLFQEWETSHIDSDRTNNHVRNLTWEDRHSNNKRKTKRPVRRNMTKQVATAIKAELRRGTSQRATAEKFGVTETAVNHIAGGRTWRKA